MKTSLRFIAASLLLAFQTGFCVAQAAVKSTYTDVPDDHPAAAALGYLLEKSILTPPADGKFNPNRIANRAEALKLIIAPQNPNPQEFNAYTTSVYTDVPKDAWYVSYVEWARIRLRIIEGPPAKTAFRAEQPVTRAEFIKMMLLGYKVDPGSYGEITDPLSTDVQSVKEWYYPYFRYAISASVVMIGQDDMLNPGKPLTRGEMAILLHRYLTYREGRRTQALLKESETELLNLFNSLDNNDLRKATEASTRAMLAARGANASRPNEPLVKTALKITESFHHLVRAYEAGVSARFDDVVTECKEAWRLADEANKIAVDGGISEENILSIIAQAKENASTMAKSARELKAGGSASSVK